jgi:chromate transporter
VEPAAHIAMMEDEFVRKRHWITEAEFLDRLAAASLIPGPSSTEVAIFIGQAKRGWPGLVIGGCCFIIPAALLVTLIAAIYVRFGSLPQVAGILYGIKPVVIAIILQALWSLARTAIKSKLLAVIGVLAVVLSGFGVAPLIVLVIAGIASGGAAWFKRQGKVSLGVIPAFGRLKGPFARSIVRLLYENILPHAESFVVADTLGHRVLIGEESVV